MTKTIIAYDLGTGGNKASLYDVDGHCLGAVFVPYETSYPKAGWHEQRPMDWWNAVVESTRKLLAAKTVDPASIECLAISGHSLGCVPVDADGRLLRESTPIWSDKRPDTQVNRFFEKIDPNQWYRLTGNGFPAAHYTLFKIMWYRDEEPALFQRICKVIGTKDFVNFKLTGQIKTDYSYASGCGAYDLKGWRYAEDLIAASGLPREIFPEIVPSTEILGTLTSEAAQELGLPRTVKVACGGVDNSCMALGARNTAVGRVYASLGSSAWIAVTSSQPLLDDRAKPYVFTHVMPGLFNSAVAIFSSGSSFKWVREQLCANVTAEAQRSGQDPYDVMTKLAAQSPLGAKKLFFCPGLAGGSSLDDSPHTRGAFVGLDLGHTQADVVRSAMEGIALNLRMVLDALRGLCPVSEEMVVVGGSSKSAFWRQLFADAWRMRIVKTQVGQEAGSLGAAAVAAVGAGLWRDFSRIDAIHKTEDVSVPDPERVRAYAELLPVFKQACRHQSQIGEMLTKPTLAVSQAGR
jgi:xylulokinase